MYKKIINTIIGFGVIAVAFMDVSATTMTWTLVAGGAIVALTNLWDLMMSSDIDQLSDKPS